MSGNEPAPCPHKRHAADTHEIFEVKPMTTAYPLTWPATMPRTAKRARGHFKSTLGAALKNVTTSIKRFAADSERPVAGLVISSNYSLGVSRPADPGVAVWFVWDGLQVCIPVDRYDTIEANLQAIHHVIEARRVEIRHGTLALVRATFTGFVALPPPPGKQHWSDVLGVPRSAKRGDIDAAYREKAKYAHPDSGGSDAAMAALNAARAAALKEVDTGAEKPGSRH